MPHEELIIAATRLAVGAIVTFLAILLWANTRDTAWMLVVLGVIVRYAGVLYATFGAFGLVADPVLFGLPILRLLLDNVPLALFGAAFVIVVARNRVA